MVVGGTLNILIRYLTNTKLYDSNFINTFLLTYRSFTTPDFLLHKLIERYNVPDRLEADQKQLVQMRVCVVMKLWVEKFNSDEERQLLPELNHFIDEALSHQDAPPVVKGLKKSVQKLTEKGKLGNYTHIEAVSLQQLRIPNQIVSNIYRL